MKLPDGRRFDKVPLMTDAAPSSPSNPTPEKRALWFITFAENQVSDLLPYVTGEIGIESPAVEVACTESFVLNVRLIIDFLTRGNPKRDITAASFTPGWSPEPALKKRLDSWFALASQHAMHLSRERVPDNVEDVGVVTPEDYRQMAADCSAALASFREAQGATIGRP